MKLFTLIALTVFSCGFLGGCASNPNNMQEATPATAQQSAGDSGQVVNVKSPETGSGHIPPTQSPGGANVAKMISPLTQ